MSATILQKIIPDKRIFDLDATLESKSLKNILVFFINSVVYTFSIV